MGRKPKEKDIAEYLWHSEPTKINATNDNWRIRYGYLDSEGKEHQTTETVNNERAKNQFVSYLLLREKEHKAAKGTTVASKVDKTEIETVEQLLYAYAEHTKYLHTIGDRYGWDEGTYRANIGKIRNYIVPVFGSFPIWKITRVDMRQGFKDMLQLPQANGNHKANGARVSQRTVYDCKKIISRAFKYATDDLELITENPMLGVTVKQPKSSRREVWTEEQFNFAYDNCSDPQLKLLISLMVALSSRIGECLALPSVGEFSALNLLHVREAVCSLDFKQCFFANHHSVNISFCPRVLIVDEHEIFSSDFFPCFVLKFFGNKLFKISPDFCCYVAFER